GAAGAGGNPCATIDSTLPKEPTIPPACTTLTASFAVTAGTPPSESSLDTSRIQAALSGCAAGQSVQLVTSGSNDGFITGPLNLPTGVSLWVDSGVTLFGTRDPNVYGQAGALISARGANSGVYGAGVIDGQGGEPQIGSTMSSWDINGGGGDNPSLIQTIGATNFTLYKITLHNAPKFHVQLGAAGFVVWGITIKTPSAATNSVGTKLTPSSAHNTDGVDPGETASNGFIVYNEISDGDDHIAIKGGNSVKNLTIAHNHFEAGHGMSIGSETNGGVSNVTVCDLSIDGTNTGLSGGSSNGIRIKSDSSRGGLVQNIFYGDVCVRAIANPIILTPKYSSSTGTEIPYYQGITIQNFRSMSTSTTPKLTLLGYDASHLLGLTLDNVVVDDITTSNISAGYAAVTLGPGNVNFTPSGSNVTVTNAIAGSSTPNDCTNKWVTF
ncbi:MAG TPA: glycosyl hydrolase family 28 protein, partial [Polyangia bacterium]|nr:glycosyl hydrolase family 28 protein [Polyangia bacterium]